jgi:hypothetical protein
MIYMRGRGEVHLRPDEPAERKGRGGIGVVVGGQIHDTDERDDKEKQQRVNESVHLESVSTHERKRWKKRQYHAGK